MTVGLTEIGVWAIVALLAFIAYIVREGLRIMRLQHQHSMTTLASLGDTHKLGYEALTLALQRLELRVKELEGRRS